MTTDRQPIDEFFDPDGKLDYRNQPDETCLGDLDNKLYDMDKSLKNLFWIVWIFGFFIIALLAKIAGFW